MQCSLTIKTRDEDPVLFSGERSGMEGVPVDLHVPFGEDPLKYLEGVSKKAVRWGLCMRKMGMFKINAAADAASDSQDAQAWEDFKQLVKGDWAFPDLTPGESEKACFVSRAKQLLQKLPSHEDGPHAHWLDPALVKHQSSQPFNTMEACLRHHHGEVRCRSVRVLVEIDDESQAPEGAEVVVDNGKIFYKATRTVSFGLADVFQYYPGTASDLYMWYLNPDNKVVAPAKQTTQSVKAAAAFAQQKNPEQ